MLIKKDLLFLFSSSALRISFLIRIPENKSLKEDNSQSFFVWREILFKMMCYLVFSVSPKYLAKLFSFTCSSIFDYTFQHLYNKNINKTNIYNSVSIFKKGMNPKTFLSDMKENLIFFIFIAFLA